MNTILAIDKDISLYINQDLRSAFLDFILPIFSEIDVIKVILFAFLAIYGYYIYKDKEDLMKKGIKPSHYFLVFFFFLLLSIAITNALSDLVKSIANRPRPSQALPLVYYMSNGQWLQTAIDMLPRMNGKSFLSSHASNSMAIATVFYLYFKKVPIFIFIIPVIVAWSRIYLGKHYLFDVVCGLAFGFCVTYCIFMIFKKYIKIFDKKD